MKKEKKKEREEKLETSMQLDMEQDEEEEEEEELPPIYIPDPPSPLYCGFYSQPDQFWLSLVLKQCLGIIRSIQMCSPIYNLLYTYSLDFTHLFVFLLTIRNN